MLTTQTIPCLLPKETADALNRESGRIYSDVMVHHWRAYRKSGRTWLSPSRGEAYSDWREACNREDSALLHAHSIDAAQQGFAKACKTTRALKKAGISARFPYKHKFYRTTIWKTSGIRQRPDHLLLSLARGREPIQVALPERLQRQEIREARLVYDLKQRRYLWHLVVEDGFTPEPVEGGKACGIDLGEIHPIALCDEEGDACILSCRELRSVGQKTARNLSLLSQKLTRCKRGSRRMRRLKAAKRRFLAKQKRRQRDLLHKVTRSAVNWMKEQGVGKVAIGDVRDIADRTKEEKRLGKKQRQRNSLWPHGAARTYLRYKAEREGIAVEDKVREHHTSKTCCCCGKRNTPKGRNYSCACGFAFARDGVGAANICSRFLHGGLAKVIPQTQTYRKPFSRWFKVRNGLRSLADIQQVALA